MHFLRPIECEVEGGVERYQTWRNPPYASQAQCTTQAGTRPAPTLSKPVARE